MKKEPFDDELSMDKIDDYNETPPEKKKTLIKVIIAVLAVAVVLGGLKYYYSDDDYIGTQEHPGIRR